MDEIVPLGSRDYWLGLGLLLLGRGMDFLSTWVATPHLVLEGNPIAKKLGWGRGIALNCVVCLGLALSPLSAIVVVTTSLLVAARNFQSAWLLRSLGEEACRAWYVSRIREARLPLILACLAGNTLLTAGVGVALLLYSGQGLVPLGIGMGIIAYAGAVAFYSLLALRRTRRAAPRNPVCQEASPIRPRNEGPGLMK